MRRDLRPGDHVARLDVPEILGDVVSVRNGWAKVRWSEHFSQWIFSNRLILLCNQDSDTKRKDKHS